VSERESKEFGRESFALIAEKAVKVAKESLEVSEWQEDPRFVEAMDTLGEGHKAEALKKLQALYRTAPQHLHARRQLFILALELKEIVLVAEHVEWALSFLAQHAAPEAVIEAYRSTRAALPHFVWSEKALLTAQRVGEKLKDNRVVVDSAKVLLAQHPDSQSVPRALLASAEAQLRENRPDLTRSTLQSLVTTFPLDPLVPHAQRKLAEVDKQLEEIRQHKEKEEREKKQAADRRQAIERNLRAADQREQERIDEQREREREDEAERQRELEEYQELERQELEREQREQEKRLQRQQQQQQAVAVQAPVVVQAPLVVQPPVDPQKELERQSLHAKQESLQAQLREVEQQRQLAQHQLEQLVRQQEALQQQLGELERQLVPMQPQAADNAVPSRKQLAS
jgi:hypothetical protein